MCSPSPFFCPRLLLCPLSQVLLTYPPDAKEITWHNGQPVQRPYRGPAQLRFEQVRLH